MWYENCSATVHARDRVPDLQRPAARGRSVAAMKPPQPGNPTAGGEAGLPAAVLGEVIGLRVVVQRLLAEAITHRAAGAEELRAEHECALEDLRRYQIVAEPAVAETVRAHAERVVDDIFTVAGIKLPADRRRSRPTESDRTA